MVSGSLHHDPLYTSCKRNNGLINGTIIIKKIIGLIVVHTECPYKVSGPRTDRFPRGRHPY